MLWLHETHLYSGCARPSTYPMACCSICDRDGIRTFRSSVFSLLGAKVPTENFRSRERKFSGTFAPRSESYRELSFPGAKVPGNFRSRDSQFTFLPDNYSLVTKITLITLITRRRKTIQVCYRRCLQ